MLPKVPSNTNKKNILLRLMADGLFLLLEGNESN
jgi:hypothetical protein